MAETNNNEDIFKKIITTNSYVKNCVNDKEKGKDIYSLSFLIDYPLTQRQCIKLGTSFEYCLNDTIKYSKFSLKNLKENNKLGSKQKDLLWIDNVNKNVYYAEIKGNLKLDTEKTNATINKCLEIQAELIAKYPQHKVHMFLIGARYYKKDIMPNFIKSKYEKIKNNLIGINDFFDALQIPIKFKNEDEYKTILNFLSKACFKY